MKNKFAIFIVSFGVFLGLDRFAFNGYFGASRHILNVISKVWSGCMQSTTVANNVIITVCILFVLWGMFLIVKSMKEDLIERQEEAKHKKKQREQENYYEKIVPDIDNAEEVIGYNYTASGKAKISVSDASERMKDYNETVERRKAYRKARRDRTNFNGKRYF